MKLYKRILALVFGDEDQGNYLDFKSGLSPDQVLFRIVSGLKAKFIANEADK